LKQTFPPLSQEFTFTYPRTEKRQGGAQEEQPVLEMKKSSPFLRSLKPMLLGKQNKTKQNKTRGEENNSGKFTYSPGVQLQRLLWRINSSEFSVLRRNQIYS